VVYFSPSVVISLSHQNRKTKKMKATTIIIAAVLSLQVSLLFAHNDETTLNANNTSAPLYMNNLAPVAPAEATFEDATETSAFTFDFSVLAPETPVEADFSDVVPEKNIDLSILAPVTPSEAGFNENIETPAINFSALAPVTPAEADFE
jgi:hypothetical protein